MNPNPPAHLDPAVIQAAADIVRAGGVVACPTEAVWGLSCDPFNQAAVKRVLALKQRDMDAGLIVIGATWEQLLPLMGRIPPAHLGPVRASWPGPLTWVCPAAAAVPAWIRGRHAGVALRMTAHPVAGALCTALGGPMVSTSANRSGQRPARTEAQVRALFPSGIDMLIPGAVGGAAGPTEIRDALSGNVLRAPP